MAALDEPSSNSFVIDETYEFSAPRFYDFICGEADEDARQAELWFEKARPYAPSPFMPRIKASREVQQILCNFGEEKIQEAPESSEKVPSALNSTVESAPESLDQTTNQAEAISAENICEVQKHMNPDVTQAETKEKSSEIEKILDPETTCSQEVCCTPAPQKKEESKKLQTAKKIASMLKNPSAVNSKKKLPKSQIKSTTKPPLSLRRDANAKNIGAAPNFGQESRAIKRQKLEGGKSRQILTVHKPSNLPHKTRAGIISNNSSFCSSTTKTTSKEDRKMYGQEQATPFVSTAELMRKFQSGTRELSLPRGSSSFSQSGAVGALQRKPKLLTLTRPKTPELETSQRVRSVKIKSSAEIEEEMMAKIPKFKACPVNKKIFEAPTLPPLPRSTPHPPEFREFRLETMLRADRNAEVSSVASFASTESQWKPHHLTARKSPVLETSLRVRPPRIKGSEELEKEELENIPKFKARPLNRKIFESKGDMGIFCNMKKQVTVPEEFNFAIDKRIPPPTAVLDLFDKFVATPSAFDMFEPHHEKKPLPKNTTPNPFHLHTDERGAEKERRMAEELMQKQLEDERARMLKANPYPYTTDYPVIPPKPEPKPCTRPEPFQLESLVRHEEEMRREMEERMRKEVEEAKMKKFKAQPILKEDPILVPEKDRKPLTEIQEFNLHVDNRAVDRAEFDKKIKEKEMVYKRCREEAEAAKMMEEEKALKQLRRSLVPHARPVPNFDHPFLPQKSGKEITKAKSPKLRVDRRKEKRRVVFPTKTAASGAAAFHMR